MLCWESTSVQGDIEFFAKMFGVLPNWIDPRAIELPTATNRDWCTARYYPNVIPTPVDLDEEIPIDAVIEVKELILHKGSAQLFGCKDRYYFWFCKALAKRTFPELFKDRI